MNGYTRKRRGLRRVLGLSLGSAMIMAMAPGVASAQTAVPDARSTDNVCESLSEYDRDRFDDTRGSSHERNVLCMADYGLTEGLRGGDSYGPRLDVNRGQMASFIARFIEDYTGEELEEGEGFRDVPDSYVHSENINKIEAVGVTEGTRRSNGEEFDPLADVSRGQMASFISRALTYIEDGQGQPETVPPRNNNDYFPDDDNSVHEDNIDALAGAGIVQGFDDGTYRPLASVKRDQMASFVMRAYDYAVDEELGDFGPVLESSVPAHGATGVSVDTDVTGTFDRDLADDSTVLLDCDDVEIEGDVDVTDNVLTFDPDDTLEYSADCVAAFFAADADDEDAGSVTTIEFTTEAAPSVTVATEDDEVIAGEVLTVTFGGDVDEIDTVSVAGDCVEDGAITVAADGTSDITIADDAEDGECVLTFDVTFDDGSTEQVTLAIDVVSQEQAALQAEVAAAEETDPEPVDVLEEDIEELDHEQYGYRVDLPFDPREADRILWVQNGTVYDQTESGAEALYLNEEMAPGTEIKVYYEFDGDWETIEVTYGDDGRVATINDVDVSDS